MNIDAEAAALAKRSSGQMSADEYAAVGHAIAVVAPATIVVFGAGRDSPLWVRINEGGRTIFLEDDKRWLPKVGEAHLVAYPTKGEIAGLPPWFGDLEPRLVLVDGPKGYRPEHPGRSASIRVAASARTLSGCVVLVHDCHRDAERSLCLAHLGPADRKVHHLWIWEALPCAS